MSQAISSMKSNMILVMTHKEENDDNENESVWRGDASINIS